jgi:hypothetical protein
VRAPKAARRAAAAAADLATTSTPDVSLSRRCTIAGRQSAAHLGLGRMVALYSCASALYQIH